MLWTCPKCGKKLRISNEQLISNDGVIVCPQCLLQARQPIDRPVDMSRHEQPEVPDAPKRKSTTTRDTVPEYKPTTPPPHKPRMKQASTSYRYTGMSGESGSGTTQRPATKRKSTGKKKSTKKKNATDGMSAWGCLGRTIVFTLVLFAAYVFFGLLLEAMQ